MAVSVLRVATTWGDICVEVAEGAVTGCDLPRVTDERQGDLRYLSALVEHPAGANRTALTEAGEMIRGLLEGKRHPRPPVRLPVASAFTTAVWTAMLDLGFGETCTYGELAAAAGSPKAARAAGHACAVNQIPLFVPCHRVLGSAGALGGFSSGLGWKRALLERERGGEVWR
ncbi:MAG TPA: methylated-DNA--[protein]-cysteine S-methyltransferase [Kiritimatiellia bacterium]|nr:methylated-DNA--[protein]-cysteine S-methyltransferase [Kiritimatiellia bacterium]